MHFKCVSIAGYPLSPFSVILLSLSNNLLVPKVTRFISFLTLQCLSLNSGLFTNFCLCNLEIS